MSMKLMTLIFSIKGHFIPSEKLILLSLADHANDQGAGIWPGQETIMARTDLTRTPLRERLDFLKEAGLLITVKEHTVKSSTERRMNVQMLEEMAEYGKRGLVHPQFEAARAEWQAKAAAKDSERAARKEAAPPVEAEGGSVVDPGGSTVDPGEGLPETQGGPVVDPAGSTVDPESLINHQLNIIETKGILGGPAQTKIPIQEIWEMAAGQLQFEMQRGVYETYIKPMRPVRFEGGAFVVAAANAYARDWVITRVGARLEGLLSGIALKRVKLVVDVLPPVQ